MANMVPYFFGSIPVTFVPFLPNGLHPPSLFCDIGKENTPVKNTKHPIPEKNQYKTTLLFFWNQYFLYLCRKLKALF